MAGEPPDGQYSALSASVARGGLWSIGWQTAGLIAGLIATPFTIRLLGPAGYGVWALLVTMFTWIALADAGMSLVSTRFAGESLARGDAEGEARAVWTAAAIAVISTGTVCAVAAWFAPSLVVHFLHVRGHLRGVSATGLRVLAAGLIATAVNNTVNTPQVVRLRWFSNSLMTAGNAVLQVLLIPVALWAFGGSVETAAIVAAGTSVLGALGAVFVAVRLQPLLRRPRISARLGRSMLGYGAATTLSGVASIVLTSAERLLLGHYAGAVTVAVYVVASRLGLLVSAIPVAVSAPLLPALVRLHGVGAHDDARRLYARGFQGAFMVLTPALFLLGFIAHPFLSVWAGSMYGQRSTPLVYIILVGVWFTSLAYMPQTYLYATERAWLLARLHVLEVLPYVLLAALLTSKWGATGAAVIWSGRSVVDAVILTAAAARAGKLSASPLSSRKWASAGTPFVLGVSVLILSGVTSGLGLRVAVASVLLVIYSFTVWTMVLTRPERDGLIALVGQLNRRPPTVKLLRADESTPDRSSNEAQNRFT